MTPTQRNVDVQAFLDEHPFSKFQWLIFWLCFLIVLLDGIDTAAIGYIAPSLAKEWSVARPQLASVLTAALLGLAVGALGSGPLADRIGRRKVLVAAVGVFALACLASSFAASLDQLTVLRFVTGLGLGAAMPNAVTMMSEYCPDNRRATLTNLMFCGFPLGAAFGGFLAAWMIPQFGWRSVLVLGGVTPLVLALVDAARPCRRSVRFLVARRAPLERASARRWARVAARRGRSPPTSRPAEAPGRAPPGAAASRSCSRATTSSAPSCCGSPTSWAW